MKRRNAVLLGNVLMGLGLVSMIGGVGLTILGHLKDVVLLPGDLAHIPVMGIFVGALVWLVGARIGGRDRVADRYWWIKHSDNGARKCGYRHKHL
ncbi:stress-induced protein YchH [Jinshanibacter sp. LJY008]|uniref:Stress-induced protein YchH n=1 Tax=Limnobaculum eriocheiris TaxID=2897391 RepID=A0A9X1MX15_9GAMM|nr:stress-induced protein YchH [Limnobaculum eriocheiris]MCD1125745.1 stress-induced protein YchH [Limnobaculum eriocheiris]